jgi:hypothetical protein
MIKRKKSLSLHFIQQCSLKLIRFLAMFQRTRTLSNPRRYRPGQSSGPCPLAEKKFIGVGQAIPIGIKQCCQKQHCVHCGQNAISRRYIRISSHRQNLALNLERLREFQTTLQSRPSASRSSNVSLAARYSGADSTGYDLFVRNPPKQ